jgi:hypothetical protein
MPLVTRNDANGLVGNAALRIDMYISAYFLLWLSMQTFWFTSHAHGVNFRITLQGDGTGHEATRQLWFRPMGCVRSFQVQRALRPGRHKLRVH